MKRENLAATLVTPVSVTKLDTLPANTEDALGGNFVTDSLIADAKAIMVYGTEVDIPSLKNADAIFRLGAGMDNININAALGKCIIPFSAPGENADSVAEMTFGMVINLARNLFSAMQWAHMLPTGHQTKKVIKENKAQFRGRELRELTAGIIGFGNIGPVLADMLLHRKAKILAYDLNPELITEEWKQRGVMQATSVSEIMKCCDVVAIHVSGTKEILTRELIFEAKPGMILLNPARETSINIPAVGDALEQGIVSYLWTDLTFEQSQSLQAKFPEKVFLTPHICAETHQSRQNTLIRASSQMKAFFTRGELLSGVVGLKETGPLGRFTFRIGIFTSASCEDITAALAGIVGSYEVSSFFNVSAPVNYHVVDFDSGDPEMILDAVKTLDGVIKANLYFGESDE